MFHRFAFYKTHKNASSWRTTLPTLFLSLLAMLFQHTAWANLEPHEAKPLTRTTDAFRLPVDLTPLSQYVELNLDPEKETITGYTEIILNKKALSDNVAFHSKGLNIQSVKVLHEHTPLTAHYSAPNAYDIITVKLPKQVHSAERIKLVIGFTSHIREDDNGLYRYKTGNDTYLFSQFQPMQARTLFPLLDEPALKTRFRFRVTTPKQYQVLHSTPAAFTVESEQTKTVTFTESEKIPSDVLAFAIGQFESVEIEGLPMPSTFYTLPGKMAQAQDAIAMIKPLYEDLAHYLDIPLPYQKMDFLAVPEFANAGMENVGLIYLAESYVLSPFATDTLDSAGQCDAAILIAHEIAHMWFGNLVTLAWWDHLWFNESFSDWIAIKFASAHLALPHCGALARQDSLTNDETQAPLKRNIKSYADVEAYGQIVYEKGYAVLNMFEDYMGEASLQHIIKRFLHDHHNGTITSENIFTYFDAKDVSFGKMVRSFVQQPAYPIVKLTPQNQQWTLSQTPIIQDETTLLLNTEETTISRPNTTKSLSSSTSRLWTIPVQLRVQGDTHYKDFTLLLDKPSMALPQEVTDSFARFEKPPLLIIDPYSRGYFRHYVPQDQLDYYSEIGEFYQVSWLDNRQHLAKLGHVDLTQTIEQEVSLLLKSIENQHTVLENELLNVIIDRFYETMPVALLPAYRTYLTQRLGGHIAKIDWSQTKEIESYEEWMELAGIHLQLAAPREYVLSSAQTLLKQPVINRNHYAQLQVLAHFADDATYAQMETAYTQARGLNKRHLLNAMGRVATPQRVQRYYDFLLSDATQDDFIDYRFQFPFFHQTLRPAVFDYLNSRAEKVQTRMESESLQWFPFNFMTGCNLDVVKSMDQLLLKWKEVPGFAEKHAEIRTQVDHCARNITKQTPALSVFLHHSTQAQ